jgi:transposase
MNSARYTPKFKVEAVSQIVGRGHSVAEVAERLELTGHRLYNWIKAVKPGKNEQQTQELNEAKSATPKLRAQLRPAEAARDQLKKAARYVGINL